MCGGEGAGGEEGGSEHERVEQVDPGGANCEVFVQMVGDYNSADAEGDIGRDVAEADGQKEWTQEEDVEEPEDRVGVHLVGAVKRCRGFWMAG